LVNALGKQLRKVWTDGADMSIVFIYGLFDPRNLELRYIGRTKHPTYIRISQHVHEAKKNNTTHKDRWVNQLLLEGLRPSVEILEECTEDNWSEIEQVWIAECKRFGLNLVNGTNGGDGLRVDSLTPEHREKIRIANTGKRYFGRIASDETRLKMSMARRGKSATWMIGYKPTEETRNKLSKAGMGRVPSDEVRQRISEGRKGIPVSEETREKLRQANLGKKASEETRQKMSSTRLNMSDETKKKLSIASKGNNRALGHVHSEEIKKQISESLVKSWAKRKLSKSNEA